METNFIENAFKPKSSPKSRLVLFLLSYFAGWWGVDRFYAGQIGLGIVKLLTFSGFGIWWLIDVILSATGEIKDENNLPINDWKIK
ncbi:TM2 domain [Mycoplasmopsis maculosa]|uniref:TM2 domain n=1 Tax=Mycoplasmopsis maculosa TaxID=114885 RepID=A0A449B3R1_9BACT|nr:TM2 domain-containing protein [Mycoplasmopsis maculosa]VEU75178.1 TM2 domain [Mycoplasmopsis maculosa]